jgi:hypothetical protein
MSWEPLSLENTAGGPGKFQEFRDFRVAPGRQMFVLAAG